MGDFPQNQSQTPSATANQDERKVNCQIVEILQHFCELQEEEKDGRPKVHCFPVPRILRLCPNRPAVEITRVVSVDPSTGDVLLPSGITGMLPEGKPWWAIANSSERGQ